MANLIESKIADKLEAENVGFFSGRFEMYSEAIRKKVNDVHMSKDAGNQPLFPTAGTFLPFAFIDGNCTGTCTPGTGPTRPGPDAPRRPNANRIQEAFYNGWLHKHGIKHLALDGPDGLAIFCFGPSSLRRNDLYLLAQSEADEHVRVAQAHLIQDDDLVLRVMYGDSIFPWRTCLRSRYNASIFDPRKDWKDDVDAAMSSVRELVEHHYGEADQMWPFMAYEKKLKISNMPLKAIYTSKMFLRNCYVCLYGNKTSERFNCQPPILEDYATAAV